MNEEVIWKAHGSRIVTLLQKVQLQWCGLEECTSHVCADGREARDLLRALGYEPDRMVKKGTR
jgi:hypothetical protein